VIFAVQQWLRRGADPADIKRVTGIPLRLIRRIRADSDGVLNDMTDWVLRQTRE
jgi:hypothetical protein